jgi:hypothetical protein
MGIHKFRIGSSWKSVNQRLDEEASSAEAGLVDARAVEAGFLGDLSPVG